jgi:hypothetical protein
LAFVFNYDFDSKARKRCPFDVYEAVSLLMYPKQCPRKEAYKSSVQLKSTDKAILSGQHELAITNSSCFLLLAALVPLTPSVLMLVPAKVLARMSSIPFIPLLSNSSWYDFNLAQAEAVSILGFWKFWQAFGTGTFWCPVGTWKMKLILVCVKSTTTYRIFKVSSRLSYH